VRIILRTALLTCVAPALLGLVGVGADAARAEPTLDQRLATAAQKLEVVVEQYNGLRVERRLSAGRAEAIRARIAPLERVAAERDGEVAAVAAAAYRAGTGTPILGLLAAGSPDELAQRLALLEHLGRGRNRVVEQLNQVTAALSAARGELARLTARHAAQGAQLTRQKKSIEAEIVRLNVLRGGPVADVALPKAIPLPSLRPGAATAAVRFAYAQLGKPYRWGGSGPGGYDCSGLTSSAWRSAGVTLPHNARAQWGSVRRIGRAQLQPGDLVFYYADIHHVGLYVGGGRIIHAPQEGERIRFDRFDYQPIHGYGRPG
jgi:hypothetical protein